MAQAKAPSRSDEETEQQLLQRAADAVSQCRWVVGECAARWTQRYARGRTDADFAILVGISPDQAYQRRRVWETFGAVRGDFPGLVWSHFYAALTWDDALECLRWAAEMQAPVAEMRAWRRAQRGEDLTAPAAEDEPVRYLPTELSAVQDPSAFAASERGAPRAGSGAPAEERAVLAGVARAAGGDPDYTPFRTDAVTPFRGEGQTEGRRAAAEPPTPEQLVRRLTATLERCVKAVTPEFQREFRKLPPEARRPLFAAASDLAETIKELR